MDEKNYINTEDMRWLIVGAYIQDVGTYILIVGAYILVVGATKM